MDRIDRDTMFMSIASIVSRRSTCPRKSVGAVIARDGRVISIGYNGAPPGMPHCTKVGCSEILYQVPLSWIQSDQETREFFAKVFDEIGCTRAIHAETNAIVFSARQGIPTNKATMYSTCATCANCAALLVLSGITKFVYLEEYRLTAGIDLLRNAGIEVIKWAE